MWVASVNGFELDAHRVAEEVHQDLSQVLAVGILGQVD